MSKILTALLFSTLGHILAWFHMNGQFKFDFMKSQWWISFMAIPIAYLFYYSTRFSYEYFGYVWNIRMIGFGLGTFIFGLMSYYFVGEVPTYKTAICLILALVIILLQLSNFK